MKDQFTSHSSRHRLRVHSPFTERVFDHLFEKSIENHRKHVRRCFVVFVILFVAITGAVFGVAPAYVRWAMGEISE